jgi:hypothetical protein
MSCPPLLAAGDDLTDGYVRELHAARREVSADLVGRQDSPIEFAEFGAW